MIRKITIFIVIILSTLSVFPGCVDIFQDIPTIYESTPTKISYNIKYGYQVECIGTGKYEINYRCDIPESIKTTSYSLLYNRNYSLLTTVNNSYLFWNISGENDDTFDLGISAHIESESNLISDLNGEGALTLEELISSNPKIVKQYSQSQSFEDRILIDTYNSNIKLIANNILNQSKTNNSFLIAKSIFIWLKENTDYQIHDGQGDVQPALVTLQKRAGDCDDLSFLYISLCRAVGIPARFVRGYLIKREGKNVAATAHAWAEVFVGSNIGNKGWVTVECACCTTSIEADINQNFGVEDAFHLRLFVDDGSNDSLNISLSGIHVQYYEKINIELQSFVIVENYLELRSDQLVVTKDNKRYYQ